MKNTDNRMIVDQVDEFIRIYKENNGPYRLDEELSEAAAKILVELVYSSPEAVAKLNAEDMMVFAVGGDNGVAVCTKKDFEDAGGFIMSGEHLDELAERHGFDAESAAQELYIEVQKNKPTKH